ncbi:unnamed protein product [Orchesella dallaii]|uniref:Dynactin subunit 3 n=1 Tax=Orchesella dallaii TaxID=48710 RepID=A0ABP1QM10_9HEXA
MSSTGDSIPTSIECLPEATQESLKLFKEKLNYLAEIVHSASSLDLEMRERKLECHTKQFHCQEIITQLGEAVLSSQLMEVHILFVPITLALRGKYEDNVSKFSNFCLKLENFIEEKTAAWKAIQPAMVTEINAVDELEEINKQLDHAITKTESMRTGLQLLKMEWESINLKELIDAVIQETDMFLQALQLN